MTRTSRATQADFVPPEPWHPARPTRGGVLTGLALAIVFLVWSSFRIAPHFALNVMGVGLALGLAAGLVHSWRHRK
jgi:hypothetical protein